MKNAPPHGLGKEVDCWYGINIAVDQLILWYSNDNKMNRQFTFPFMHVKFNTCHAGLDFVIMRQKILIILIAIVMTEQPRVAATLTSIN